MNQPQPTNPKLDQGSVTLQVRDRVGIVTLSRPAKLNALTPTLLEDFRAAVDSAERDPRVVALVITGEGKAFCSGLDVGELAGHADRGPIAPEDIEDPRDEIPVLFGQLLQIGKPVIAAVNGVAAGGGFVLAMMCDIRFASPDARFTTVFGRRGLVAEQALSYLLPRQIGLSRALDMMLSARLVGGEEAHCMGFVDHLAAADDLLKAATDYAARIAATVSPRSIAVMKTQTYDDLSRTLMDSAREGNRLTQNSLGFPDVAEGAQAFLEKRAPRFSPWTGEGEKR